MPPRRLRCRVCTGVAVLPEGTTRVIRRARMVREGQPQLRGGRSLRLRHRLRRLSLPFPPWTTKL